MCLAIFLGLKHTPLSALAGKTYRDLNYLHRSCGYTTVAEVILHGRSAFGPIKSLLVAADISHSLYSSGLYQHRVPYVLRQPIVYAGAVAGVAMLGIGLTANPWFRVRFFEAFYMLHVLMVAIVLVAGM